MCADYVCRCFYTRKRHLLWRMWEKHFHITMVGLDDIRSTLASMLPPLQCTRNIANLIESSRISCNCCEQYRVRRFSRSMSIICPYIATICAIEDIYKVLSICSWCKMMCKQSSTNQQGRNVIILYIGFGLLSFKYDNFISIAYHMAAI